MKTIVLFCVLFLSALILSPEAVRAQSVARPPQYILMSYDGSYNLDAWKAIRAVSQNQKNAGVDTRFTFFASGVYFLQSNIKTTYQAPGRPAGRSDIGFGGLKSEIELRVDEMNRAFSEGHEIGSHANGHFNGSTWSFNDWMSEFNQFENLIFNTFSINNFSRARGFANGWLFQKEDIRGFRAPLLGENGSLYQALKAKNFSYDCSRVASTEYWPEKLTSGIWNFPLASLRIAGTNKKTLSMDYNFYANQSGAKADLQNKELYAKQMYETYIDWFKKNYNGGRAPMNIGHHFSSWNGGAYFSALNKFATKVCGLPEVKCVTYKEYVNWLESQPATTLASYKRGQFVKAASLQVAALGENQAPVVDANVQVAMQTNAEGKEVLVAKARSASRAAMAGLTARLSVDGNLFNYSALDLEAIKAEAPSATSKVTAHLYNDQGVEISRSTQTLSGLQSDQTKLSRESLEEKTLMGDLPEAHLDEKNLPFVVPNF